MRLFSMHAYSISPQRYTATYEKPSGGAIRITSELRTLMEETMSGASLESQTEVNFDVDTTTRTCEVRDLIMSFAFGQSSTAKAAALRLAERLSMEMDDRSAPCLFVPAARERDPEREITLWTFPREDAFQLVNNDRGPSLEVLHDIFSQKSQLRKAAQFSGEDIRTDFLTGHVMDFQTGNRSKVVAEFWIKRFLQCSHSLRSKAGTMALAKTIKKAIDRCGDPDIRDQLYAAMTLVGASKRRILSQKSFAEQYLDSEARDVFLGAASGKEVDLKFDFQRDVFSNAVQTRVFYLETGTVIQAPVSEIGESILLKKKGRERTLSCTGTVSRDRLKVSNA